MEHVRIWKFATSVVSFTNQLMVKRCTRVGWGSARNATLTIYTQGVASSKNWSQKKIRQITELYVLIIILLEMFWLRLYSTLRLPRTMRSRKIQWNTCTKLILSAQLFYAHCVFCKTVGKIHWMTLKIPVKFVAIIVQLLGLCQTSTKPKLAKSTYANDP